MSWRALDFGSRLLFYRIKALDTPLTYRDLIEVAHAASLRMEQTIVARAEADAARDG